MVYFDVKPLGDLIREYYEYHKGAGYIDEIKAVNSWSKVVGTFVAKHTIDLSIRNKVLYVRVDSDALRNELGYSKSQLIKSLNELVGKDVVSEIVLS